MIAGPIIPRTLDSLWDLVRGDPERLESGLRILSHELCLDGGLSIDVLARDASGAPVLLFGAVLENDRHLAGRLFEARSWFARNQRALAAAFEGLGLRLDLPARIFVVGFEFSESCLCRLRAIGDDGLAVFRFAAFSVDGRCHVGVLPVLGGGAGPASSPFDLPPALLHGAARDVVAGFVDLLSRLDPDLTAVGDRFCRRFYARGGLLCELRLDGSVVLALVPGVPARPLRSDADRAEVFDDVLRRYGGPMAVPVPEGAGGIEDLSGPVAEHEVYAEFDAYAEHATHAEQTTPTGPHAPRRDPQHSELSIDRIGQRLADTEISQEEYDAFQNLESRKHSR